MTCEIHAREKIDQLLTQSGWLVQDVKGTNIFAGKGVAIREFTLKQGHGFADYLLYVDGKAAGVIEAKKTGTTLTGVETQSDKYAHGLPDNLHAWSRPLPFCYESTGDETRFTNNLDPAPRSRQVFAFHKPDYIFEEAEKIASQTAEASPEYLSLHSTLRGRLRHMPELIEEGFWPAQIQAIRNLEKSLARDCPRSLIQMATGSGKTFTAISSIYRLVKFAGARRVLFLVDRGNLGKQTLKEFQQYVSPYNNYKFSEEFIVQRLTSNTIDTTARVCISTIQRLYSMLRGEALPEEAENQSPQGLDSLFKEILPLEYNPNIDISTFTVDMIATGTDIKPLEIVMFMRAVRSRFFFEQMKGRGVRIINANDLQSVTTDAKVKDHFIIVDCVGVCEMDKTDSRPMERKPTVSLEKLLQAVSLGNTDPDVISSLAARMARIGRQITPEDDRQVIELSSGKTIEQLTTDLVTAIKPDNHIERARQDNGGVEPSEEQIKQAATKLIVEATRPLHNPELRNFLVEVKKKNEQIIDNISEDQVISAEFSVEALEKVKSMVQSFEQFLADNRDEITALQVLYSRPYKSRLRFEDIKELAGMIEKPPHHFRVDSLWDAYAALEKAKVKGANAPHILTDLVSLIRVAMHQENELVPFPEKVETNFNAWLSQQEASGKKFTDEQRQWLVMIRDHIAANLGIETDDFDYAPFSQQGGLGKVFQLFGDELNVIVEELNEALAA